MFTGIVTAVGTVITSEDRGDRRLTIAAPFAMNDVAIGASIACSGVCLTVVDKGGSPAGTASDDAAGGWFAVDVSRETLSRTAPGLWQSGARLNLERSLRVGDELGGHIVTGHVDGIGTIADVRAEGGSHRLRIIAPPALAPFIAAKGSICVDGVSLTVNDVMDDGGQTSFGLNIIPHSWAVTTLADSRAGGAVNLEIDVLARYLSRMRDVLAG